MNVDPEGSRPRVLVIDDETPVRLFASELLSAEGFETNDVGTLAEANSLLQSTCYDLALLDISLGDGSGLNFISHIRDRQPQCSVVMLSARDDPQVILEAIRNGAEDYILKPATAQIMRLVVNRVVERKRLERENLRYREQLEESLKQLQHVQQLKDDMTSMVIHDLKQPLTQILGCLELCALTGGQSVPHKQREYLASMRAGCDEMLRMVHTLLNIVQMDSGEVELQMVPVPARSLLAGVLTRNRAIADLRHHTLQTVDPPELTVCADSSLLNRMLDNLVANALKYTPDGGTIAIGIEPGPHGTVRIYVEDNGPGIPEEFHESLFRRFGHREIAQATGRGDTGLGLAFCKMAAELHRGKVRLESPGDKGCRFVVALPAAGPDSSGAVALTRMAKSQPKLRASQESEASATTARRTTANSG